MLFIDSYIGFSISFGETSSLFNTSFRKEASAVLAVFIACLEVSFIAVVHVLYIYREPKTANAITIRKRKNFDLLILFTHLIVDLVIFFTIPLSLYLLT